MGGEGTPPLPILTATISISEHAVFSPHRKHFISQNLQQNKSLIQAENSSASSVYTIILQQTSPTQNIFIHSYTMHLQTLDYKKNWQGTNKKKEDVSTRNNL